MRKEKKTQMTASPKRSHDPAASPPLPDGYQVFLGEVSSLQSEAIKQAVRAVNPVLVASYCELGRRIVEFEQGGRERADYGAQVIERLSRDLTEKFAKGFSLQNLQHMRQLYTVYPPGQIRRTVSGDSLGSMCQAVSRKLAEQKISGTATRIFPLDDLMAALPLSWSYEGHLSKKIENTRRLLDERAGRKTGDVP
ncbi:conserved hypothetical protein [uncultured Desulfatiglans sp.]|uniref:YhcG N-terminal domain-containing protein n=1 Tax=Uncultured Desulfatiglans sp. TaxID=1748965 RepID=A0A653AF23_UNCDX|nr:conserved hypothetical protein [uncultured Desulfatiglans sp.]